MNFLSLKKEFLPTRTSYKKCIFVIVLLLFIYFLDYSKIKSYGRLFYFLEPASWVLLTLIIWTMPHIGSKSKPKYKRLIYFWAFNFSLIFIIINIGAGIIAGFGRSPYDHSLRGIILNIIFVGSKLTARETARSFLINNISKKENYFIFIGTAFFLTLISYPISKYIQLKTLKEAVIFTAEFFAPEFSHNIFASYLTYWGGPLASIIYLGIIQAFHWLSPVLPDLKWIVTALIGILCPSFFMMGFQPMYLHTAKLIKRRHTDEESPFGWIVASIISISIIWFVVGVFPVYPSVIATGSMEPVIYPGDIVLVSKINKIEEIKELKPDDIIQFKRESILITHRIVEVMEGGEYGIAFVTKGDNNSSADDEYVNPQDIKGIIKYVIPKIGWPTLLIKSTRDIPLDEIVF